MKYLLMRYKVCDEVHSYEIHRDEIQRDGIHGDEIIKNFHPHGEFLTASPPKFSKYKIPLYPLAPREISEHLPI